MRQRVPAVMKAKTKLVVSVRAPMTVDPRAWPRTRLMKRIEVPAALFAAVSEAQMMSAEVAATKNLLTHVARGREWATPGVQLAVQRAVAGLGTGLETASPRLQAVLRRLADDLAGGMETLAPRVQENT
jgi:hypothetical protein